MPHDIRYALEAPPPPGVLQPVAPGVHWLRMPLPFALDHVNLWLLEDGPGLALVDTGLGDPATRAVWEDLLPRLGRPLTRILVTHFHPDHLGNAHWLSARTGAPISMSAAEFLLAHAIHGQTAGYTVAAMVDHFRSHGLGPGACASLQALGNTFALGAPVLPTTTRRLLDGDREVIDGEPWVAIAGHGQSPEHISLHAPGKGILISGDLLLPRITTNVSVSAVAPEEDAVGRFLASIRRFQGLGEGVLVLPSHGRPFRGAGARVAQLEAHHRQRDQLILEALDRPRCIAELLPVLFNRELDGHEILFGMGEAIAHLNHLVSLGAVDRWTGADGRILGVARDRRPGGGPHAGPGDHIG